MIIQQCMICVVSFTFLYLVPYNIIGLIVVW